MSVRCGVGYDGLLRGAKNACDAEYHGRRGPAGRKRADVSSRFLLMSFGAALGGWASARFGYQTASSSTPRLPRLRLLNLLIPEKEMKEESVDESGRRLESQSREPKKRQRFWTDIWDGWRYIARHPLVAAIIGGTCCGQRAAALVT